MPMYGMFSRRVWPEGARIHKAADDPGGAVYGNAGRASRGKGIGFDGSLHTRCGQELPRYGTAERAALDPPEDTALRWKDVNCEACLALRYGGVPLGRDAETWCACGHGEEEHSEGRCWSCGSALSRYVCGPVQPGRLRRTYIGH